MGQAWFRERYQNFYTIIVNNFAEPSETPEHNAMQAEFLDPRFLRAFTMATAPKRLLGTVEELIKAARVGLESVQELMAKEAAELEAIRSAALETIDADESDSVAADPSLPDLRDFIRARRAALAGFMDQGARLRMGRAGRCVIVTARSDIYVRYLTDNLTLISELASQLYGRRIVAIMDTAPATPSTSTETLDSQHSALVARLEQLTKYRDLIVSSNLEPTKIDLVEFESAGIDVQFRAYWTQLDSRSWATYAIELKPVLTDDYPAVLRQIRATTAYRQLGEAICLIGNYTGQGATLDQVRQIFASANIELILRSEIPDQTRNTSLGTNV
jgi:hypothetical protein